MGRVDRLGILLAVLLCAGGLAGLVAVNSRGPRVVALMSSPYVAHVQNAEEGCSPLLGTNACVPPAPEPMAWPAVTDSSGPGYVVGDVLSTTRGIWFGGQGALRFAYQWVRCSASGRDCAPVPGADRRTYVTTPGDAGRSMRAVVTALDGQAATPQASAPTPAIGGNGPTNPACSIEAATTVGVRAAHTAMVRAAPSRSSPLAALSAYLAPSATSAVGTVRGALYTDANGNPGGLITQSNALPLSTAGRAGWYTLSFPAPASLTSGTPYWLGVTGGGPGVLQICGIQSPVGSPASAASPAIADVTAPGAWAPGDLVSATSGTWLPAADAYHYQWQQCSQTGASCTDIADATGISHVLSAADLGHTVRVVVTATNASGSGSAASSVSGAAPFSVSTTPDGPPTPAGGWSVAYADGFGSPLGTGSGRDNTVWPSRITGNCTNNPSFNTNEMEVFNCSQATVDAHGLELTCTYAPQIETGKNYNCGAANTGATGGSPTQLPGYRLFQFEPGHGQEWAIQIVAKFPTNSGEADPGAWVADPTWTWEIDVFEGFGYTAGAGGTWCHHTSGNGWIGATDPTWIYRTRPDLLSVGANEMLCKNAQPAPLDPSTGYHTYTTLILPNDTMSEYIDGHIQQWDYISSGGSAYRPGGTVIGPAGDPAQHYGGLILSYGLRDAATGNPDPHFTSGSRTFSVRSVAVYENASADGAFAVNPGLVAPGTTVVR